MKIEVVKDIDESIKAFQKREWDLEDTKRFGKPAEWDIYDGYYVKAMDGDRIVGIIDLVVAHGVAKIKDIIVDHSQRQQGIGKKLMVEAEEIARKSNAHKMFLETGEDWEARKFYESLGYEVEGILRDHSFHKNFIYYSKKLDQKGEGRLS